jgi:hypothetical protein
MMTSKIARNLKNNKPGYDDSNPLRFPLIIKPKGAHKFLEQSPNPLGEPQIQKLIDQGYTRGK